MQNMRTPVPSGAAEKLIPDALKDHCTPLQNRLLGGISNSQSDGWLKPESGSPYLGFTSLRRACTTSAAFSILAGEASTQPENVSTNTSRSEAPGSLQHLGEVHLPVFQRTMSHMLYPLFQWGSLNIRVIVDT